TAAPQWGGRRVTDVGLVFSDVGDGSAHQREKRVVGRGVCSCQFRRRNPHRGRRQVRSIESVGEVHRGSISPDAHLIEDVGDGLGHVQGGLTAGNQVPAMQAGTERLEAGVEIAGLKVQGGKEGHWRSLYLDFVGPSSQKTQLSYIL